MYRFDTETFDEEFQSQKEREVDLLMNSEEKHMELLNAPITKQEVKKSVEKSRFGKAVGVDGVSNELLKNEKVHDLLYHLFNLCFQNQRVPDLWKRTIIHPNTQRKWKSD